ncbi:serine hydrolase domain-containing protein [Nocardia takedensis]|uniref:serine hydrolase domain-containing protein n=1 Tax=Nocardia takedensis TaxID=259390 RepID=UPI0002D67BD3|nr:serine hydrolase domain-containing protein [Nocardia takedensis]
MTTAVSGTCDRAFAPVRELFEANLADGLDRGAAVAVCVGGRPVVDLWGGVADHKQGRDWERDTPCVVFSSTKAVTATAALLVAQEHDLDLGAPVTDWWPEFGAAGKQDTTGEDLLTHRAGVPAFDRPVTLDEAADQATAAGLLAAQTPLWEPGTEHGYHALTMGWLAAEIVRRHNRTPLREFVRERFGPELWIGASPEVIARAARVGQPAQTTWSPENLPGDADQVRRLAAAFTDPESLIMRATGNPAGSFNNPAVLAGGWPGAGLVTTARALAGFYRDLLRGEFLTPERLREATRERVRGPDAVLLLESAYGLGYMLPSPNFRLPAAARHTAFGHPGAGGSIGVGDLEHDLAFAFVPNLLRDGLAGDRRAHDLLAAVYAAL